MKNNRKIRQKRKLLKTTIIGIVVLIVIQLYIIYSFIDDKYQFQQASSDNTYTETIYVDRAVYFRLKNTPGSIYVYSDDIRWNLHAKLAREHTKKSPDEICQSLEGSSLTVTCKKWAKGVVDARDEDTVYYTIDEYNAYAEKRDKESIWLLVFLEFIYVMCSGAWILYKVLEWKPIVMSSKRKKSKKYERISQK